MMIYVRKKLKYLNLLLLNYVADININLTII